MTTTRTAKQQSAKRARPARPEASSKTALRRGPAKARPGDGAATASGRPGAVAAVVPVVTAQPSSEQAAGSVRITAAKGRPMLVWVGKRPLSHVTTFPAQAVERFTAVPPPSASQGRWDEWPAVYPHGGLLFHGDNKEVLAHLLANGFRGKVNLIYIDPPFDSGADYVRKVSLRGATGSAKIDGERYTLGEQIQYTDIWANDNYLQFMFERLLLIKELLARDGSLYLHCDPSRNSYIRILMDEVFGCDNFVNEIVWQRLSAHSDASRYGIVHDTIYYYSKSDQRSWNPPPVALAERYIDQFFDQVEPETGRRYARGDLTAKGLRFGETGKAWRGIDPAARGRHWTVPPAQLDALESEGRIHWPRDGMPRLKRYLDEVRANGAAPQDVWYDIRPIHNQSQELLDFPTQKPEALIERVLKTSSAPEDIVLDCFVGSGTTAAVAQKLGRRWIACDINKGAIQTTAKRLQAIMRDQVEEANVRSDAERQGSLLGADDGKEEPPAPAQLSFSVWRVNDYDLQIQHNEAVALACEHIGVQRIRTDSFFDGTLGKRLVKIIPFDHPLSPADLDEVRRELDARPDEDREITLVCLGMEIAAKAWVDDWNRLRKGRNAANRVHVIELRTDQKYGRFIRHEPAKASVKVQRRRERLCIAIEEFISPSIIERLRQQAGVLQPAIEDWRAMVDCVMIDPAWDGQVFNVVLSDIPERKGDLVQGTYELPAPPGDKTTVAVKIIDMLGEEVLVTSNV